MAATQLRMADDFYHHWHLGIPVARIVARLLPAAHKTSMADGDGRARTHTRWARLLSRWKRAIYHGRDLLDGATCSVIGRSGQLCFRGFWSIRSWWLYITWLPLFLYKVHGFDLKKIGLFAWVPFVAADAGSLLGGFTSGYLMRRGWSVNRARKATIGFAALLMPAGILAARTADPMLALALIGLVLFGFQFWINNVQTLPSDFFGDHSVASVAGLGGTGAGLGSMIFILATDG